MDEEVRGVRQRKRNADPTCCPICGITVRPNEIEQHLSLEMNRLDKLTKRNKTVAPRRNSSRPSTSASASLPSTSTSYMNPDGSDNIDGDDCWSRYQRIRLNRNARLRVMYSNDA